IDLVLAERRLIMFKAQRPQPARDVHPGPHLTYDRLLYTGGCPAADRVERSETIFLELPALLAPIGIVTLKEPHDQPGGSRLTRRSLMLPTWPCWFGPGAKNAPRKNFASCWRELVLD